MLTKLLCEFGATALMIIFGVGVHCDTVLKGTKYQGSGHMFAITTWSFGISVCLFVFGGAVCMNPAMVLAQCIVGLVPWSSCIPFMIADMLGGFVGAVIAWLRRPHCSAQHLLDQPHHRGYELCPQLLLRGHLHLCLHQRHPCCR